MTNNEYDLPKVQEAMRFQTAPEATQYDTTPEAMRPMESPKATRYNSSPEATLLLNSPGTKKRLSTRVTERMSLVVASVWAPRSRKR